MKYCEEYAALLDLFVDGELPPEDMARVGDHLESCPGCRSYVDDALAIRAGFPAVEDTAVPEGFAEGVMERVRRDAERERKAAELRRRSLRRWAGTLGALAACCALVILVRTGPGDFKGGVAEDTAAVVTGEAGTESSGAPMDLDGSEAGVAPQMAAAPSGAPEESAQEEDAVPARTRMAAAEDGANTKTSEKMENGLTSTYGDLPLAASAQAGEAALYLTAEEAGDLLDGYAVVWENAVEWHYELSAEEYRALLEALGRREKLPEETEGSFLVVVTGPVE